MKKHIVLIVMGALALVALVLIVLFAFRGSEEPEVPEDFGNPFAGIESETVEIVPQVVTNVTLENGQRVAIPDPTAIEQEEGHTPSAGYVFGGGFADSFRIVYYPPERGGTERILISLMQEPLSVSRAAAEQRLREYTRLPDAQLCALADIEVWVLRDINPLYEGRDLGLSFCAGATTLP